MERRVPFVVVVCLVLAGCDRGAWWWGKFGTLAPGSIDEFHTASGGSTAPAVPNAGDLLPVLNSCGVDVLYGSYGDLPLTDPQWVWEWNSALHGWGKESQLLLADPDWILDHEPLVDLLEERIGWWYRSPVGMSINAGFDGIHLDIEPVQHPACKIATNDPVACRALHEGLLDAVTAVRTWIDGTAPGLELYVDLHHWTDEIGGRVDWSTGFAGTAAGNRDAWYAQLSAQVDGVTIMAYHPNPLTVVSRSAWEFMNLPVQVRVGVDTDDYSTLGANGTDGLWDAAWTLEIDHGHLVDIHRFNDLAAAGGCF